MHAVEMISQQIAHLWLGVHGACPDSSARTTCVVRKVPFGGMVWFVVEHVATNWHRCMRAGHVACASVYGSVTNGDNFQCSTTGSDAKYLTKWDPNDAGACSWRETQRMRQLFCWQAGKTWKLDDGSMTNCTHFIGCVLHCRAMASLGFGNCDSSWEIMPFDNNANIWTFWRVGNSYLECHVSGFHVSELIGGIDRWNLN